MLRRRLLLLGRGALFSRFPSSGFSPAGFFSMGIISAVSISALVAISLLVSVDAEACRFVEGACCVDASLFSGSRLFICRLNCFCST